MTDGPTLATVCSGIGAPETALEPLGYRPVWAAEIEAFPSAVLAQRHPAVPNLGDMTTLARRVLAGTIAAPDVLVGGTPCQAFSLAGMRRGLADARGLLTIRFVELADAIDHVRARRGAGPCTVWWENVPGVLSDKDNAFGCFLAALVGESEPLVPPGGRWEDAGCVYGPRRTVAWRVLDAQYFGLAQRRRRVFVVASARSGFDPCAVLFESDGVRRDSAPRRQAGEGFTRSAAASVALRGREGGGAAELGDDCAFTLRASSGGGDKPHALIGGGLPNVSMCLNAGAMGRQDAESETLIPTFGVGFDVAHTLRADGFDASEDGTGQGTPLIPVAFSCKDYGADADADADVAPTLRAMGHAGSHPNAGGQVAVAFAQNQRDEVRAMEVAGALAAEPGAKQQTYLAQAMAVRRLTPRECERLQGFPDDYTAIAWRGKPAEDCPDGPRYKALGNSMAVPVMGWIGARLLRALQARTVAA